jgi:riboflavin transporter FmnP
MREPCDGLAFLLSEVTVKEKFKVKITVAYIAKVAMLSAISFVLYMYCKFSLPFIFPSFLEMQFSELPAILAGFSLGPVAGAIVIIVKCLIKFPFSSTAFVGEIIDILLGLCYVLPASVIYKNHKDKKHAVTGLIAGIIVSAAASMLLNRFVAVPFYVKLFFGGDFGAIVAVCSSLYPGVTEASFYSLYIFAGVLPFNLLRLGLVSLITFFVYKRLSKILHWEISPHKKTYADERGCKNEDKDL